MLRNNDGLRLFLVVPHRVATGRIIKHQQDRNRDNANECASSAIVPGASTTTGWRGCNEGYQGEERPVCVLSQNYCSQWTTR